MIYLRIIALVMFGIWLGLIVMGKSGFVHILILMAIGLAVVDLTTLFRTKMKP